MVCSNSFFHWLYQRGRTVRQVVLGGYSFGLAGTFTSFIILGNYGMGLQMHGRLDLLSVYTKTGDLYAAIVSVLEQLPLPGLVLILLVLCMVTFYSTSFDSITLVAAALFLQGAEAERGTKPEHLNCSGLLC